MATKAKKARAYLRIDSEKKELMEEICKIEGITFTQFVDEAIDNIKKFSIVGCLEHLDKFRQQFEDIQKVQLNISTSNINPLARSKQQQQISEEIRLRVEKICEPDLKIYNYVLSQL